MIDKNLVLVAARHTPTALKEPCVWQHQTAESVSDLPQDERAFAGDLCVFAASDGTKTAFRYEHYWECDGEKKFDVYAPEVISENGTVVFTKDGEEVEELTYGDTVTVTVTADQGYQVKTITLNGEEIENGAEITVDGDITLVAEFEEAPAPIGYTWNGTDTSEHDITGANLQHYMGEAPSYAKADYIGATVIRKLGDTETEYVLTEDDMSEFEQDEMYGLEITCGEHSSVGVIRGMEGMTDGLYFMKELEGSDTGMYTASMVLGSTPPTPSEYTWDGEAVEGDIVIEDVGIVHKASDDILLPDDLVGGTVTFNINPETQEATPTTCTLVDDEPGAGEIAVAISEDNGFTEIGSFSSFFSGQGDLMGYTLDGTYFVKLYDLGVFITELNPPTA